MRRFELWRGLPVNGCLAHDWLAGYGSEATARKGIPRKFADLPKELCWEIILTGPGIEREIFPHPSRCVVVPPGQRHDDEGFKP